MVAARHLRDDFKPDKNYVDGVCKEKGPGTYTYSPTGSNTLLFIYSITRASHFLSHLKKKQIELVVLLNVDHVLKKTISTSIWHEHKFCGVEEIRWGVQMYLVSRE